PGAPRSPRSRAARTPGARCRARPARRRAPRGATRGSRTRAWGGPWGPFLPASAPRCGEERVAAVLDVHAGRRAVAGQHEDVRGEGTVRVCEGRSNRYVVPAV